MDLLEVDGFYAGIASTVIGRGRIDRLPNPDEIEKVEYCFAAYKGHLGLGLS